MCAPRKIKAVLSALPAEQHPWQLALRARKEMPLWDAGGLEDLLLPARWMQP